MGHVERCVESDAEHRAGRQVYVVAFGGRDCSTAADENACQRAARHVQAECGPSEGLANQPDELSAPSLCQSIAEKLPNVLSAIAGGTTDLGLIAPIKAPLLELTLAIIRQSAKADSLAPSVSAINLCVSAHVIAGAYPEKAGAVFRHTEESLSRLLVHGKASLH